VFDLREIVPKSKWVEACLLLDQTSGNIARGLVAGVLADMEQLRNCFLIMHQLSVHGDSGCVQHD